MDLTLLLQVVVTIRPQMQLINQTNILVQLLTALKCSIVQALFGQTALWFAVYTSFDSTRRRIDKMVAKAINVTFNPLLSSLHDVKHLPRRNIV